MLILGAGFGGLEVAAGLSEAMSGRLQVTLIDQNEGFIFGFSKLDMIFHGKSENQVLCRYSDIDLPGVEFRQERVTSIDPKSRRVVTDAATYESDVLVVALGADYDQAATPGFVEDGYDFYSVSGAARLAERLSTFDGGAVIIGILGVPFKCPPAPYETAFLLHDYLVRRGVREATRIEVISPMPSPIPVSVSASEAIVAALAERNIRYTPGHLVRGLDPVRHVALLKDESRPYDLFLGVPIHRVPAVVEASGLTAGGNDGWVAVDRNTLATPFPGVYALGDCADAPVPRAGAMAESAGKVVAAHIVAAIRDSGTTSAYAGDGTCYVELGGGVVAKVVGDFLSGPAPSMQFVAPSAAWSAEKSAWADRLRHRWFGY